MIKAIIFDFDGVIIESAGVKTEAFRELFSDYPHKIKEIIDYHLVNAGISRFVKFRHIYKHMLKQGLSGEKEAELGRCFSQIVLKKLMAVPFVPGAKDFLQSNKSRYQFFVASGTPEKELVDIINTRGLEGYFKEIHGSPKEKADIIGGIMSDHGLTKGEVVYVGDAQSDRIAAQQTGVTFIERVSDAGLGPDHHWRIKDLCDISEVLKKIETVTFERRD